MEFDGFFWNSMDLTGAPFPYCSHTMGRLWEWGSHRSHRGSLERRCRNHPMVWDIGDIDSAFHVKVMDLFHATWLSSAIVSQVPGCICLHLVVPNVFSCHGTSTRLRHATRFSEPGLRHDFGAQDTVPTEVQLEMQMCGIFPGLSSMVIPQWESKHNVYVSLYI